MTKFAVAPMILFLFLFGVCLSFTEPTNFIVGDPEVSVIELTKVTWPWGDKMEKKFIYLLKQLTKLQKKVGILTVRLYEETKDAIPDLEFTAATARQATLDYSNQEQRDIHLEQRQREDLYRIYTERALARVIDRIKEAAKRKQYITVFGRTRFEFFHWGILTRVQKKLKKKGFQVECMYSIFKWSCLFDHDCPKTEDPERCNFLSISWNK